MTAVPFPEKRLLRLTPEQQAMLPVWRDKWIAIGLSTEPADRPRAEAAYRACYRAAGLDDQVPIVWVSSPIVGAFAASISAATLTPIDTAIYSAPTSQVSAAAISEFLRSVGRPVDEAVSDPVKWTVESAPEPAARDLIANSVVYRVVKTAIHNAILAEISGDAQLYAMDLVETPVDLEIDSKVDHQVGSELRSIFETEIDRRIMASFGKGAPAVGSAGTWHPWLGGALWAGWPAFESFFRDCCGLQLSDDLSDRARAYAATSETAGYWWPNKRFIIACDRPAAINRDDRGRLHSATGPAIVWRDGWGIHSWHGVTVPREWIEAPGSLTAAAALGEKNTERRRAACEILGWQKVLDEIGARVIDCDADPEIGELLAADLPDAPGSRFLRVRCGTGRTFVLPVPPDVRTALEANAWTYDVPNDLLANKEIRT